MACTVLRCYVTNSSRNIYFVNCQLNLKVLLLDFKVLLLDAVVRLGCKMDERKKKKNVVLPLFFVFFIL